jgi:hypothetical protein
MVMCKMHRFMIHYEQKKKFSIKECCFPKRVRVRPNQGGSRKIEGISQQGGNCKRRENTMRP